MNERRRRHKAMMERDKTLDAIEDVIEQFVVVLDGIRQRGGIREFFRLWPDAHKVQFIEKATRFASLVSWFTTESETESEQELSTIVVERYKTDHH